MGITTLTQEQDIARICHEANKALCYIYGDVVPNYDEVSEEIRQSAIKGVQAVLKDPDITPEQLHDKWMQTRLADGWVFGETKDSQAKTPPCLVPYSELPLSQKHKDHLFRAVVKSFLEER